MRLLTILPRYLQKLISSLFAKQPKLPLMKYQHVYQSSKDWYLNPIPYYLKR